MRASPATRRMRATRRSSSSWRPSAGSSWPDGSPRAPAASSTATRTCSTASATGRSCPSAPLSPVRASSWPRGRCPFARSCSAVSPAASVSSEFIELTNVAVANQTALVSGDGATPAETRDLVSYADAYDPLADELEALAQFLRHSTRTARNIAGTEALNRYAMARRLAKQRKTAHLAPHVADMRRALGRVRPVSPEVAAQKAAAKAAIATKRAAKAAARAAKTPPNPPASTPPEPTHTPQ